jgi:hypothetical protein
MCIVRLFVPFAEKGKRSRFAGNFPVKRVIFGVKIAKSSFFLLQIKTNPKKTVYFVP